MKTEKNINRILIFISFWSFSYWLHNYLQIEATLSCMHPYLIYVHSLSLSVSTDLIMKL